MRIQRQRQIFILAILAILFALIMWLVTTGRADSFDFPVRNAILAISPPDVVDIWKTVTFFGSTLTITCLTILVMLTLLMRREWQTSVQFVVVMIGTSFIDLGLKWAIHRPRPQEIFPHTMPSSYSFPSGHALFSFAFYISFALIVAPHVSRLTRIVVVALAILFVVLIGASRILLGVHYPLDVVGGYSAAALWLALMRWYQQTHTLPGTYTI